MTMKSKITFGMWLSVFFGGIWQFIRNIFSWKNKTPFWRVIWATISVCLVLITGSVIYEVYRDYKDDDFWSHCEPISSSMDFRRNTYTNDPGWLVNHSTGEVITRDVDWIAVSDDEDSLAVFASKGKRGYINRYSGKVAIEPQFEKAWVFSSGVAGVMKDNKVFFIDHSGKPINDRTYAYDPRISYVFHGDYCVMSDEDNMQGLIDRDGNWVLAPDYAMIRSEVRNYWTMRKDDMDGGMWYAFTDKLEPVNDIGVSHIQVIDNLGIVYTLPNHMTMVVDFNGTRMEKFLCHSIDAIYYDTEQRDSTGSFIPAKCTLYRYRMNDGYEGLCKENGDVVTDPIYWEITPVGKDLYHCSYRGAGLGVIINSKGEITGSK